MFENLKADIAHARRVNAPAGWWNQHVRVLLNFGFLAVASYRLSRWTRSVRIPVLRQVLVILSEILRRLTQIVTGVDISPNADIGPGFVVHTCFGVFVARTKIGARCVVQTGVVITNGTRSIGDNVYFGPGAKVIGQCAIGNNVLVVANSLVMTDVADNLTVVGVPARIRLPRGGSLRFATAPVGPATPQEKAG